MWPYAKMVLAHTYEYGMCSEELLNLVQETMGHDQMCVIYIMITFMLLTELLNS